jgi:hypothetical protein
LRESGFSTLTQSLIGISYSRPIRRLNSRHQPSLDVGLDLQTARRRLAVVGSPSAATTAECETSFEVCFDFHSSSPVRSFCLSYGD